MEAPPRPAIATVQALWAQIDRVRVLDLSAIVADVDQSEAGEISVKKAQVLLRILHSIVAALQSQHKCAPFSFALQSDGCSSQRPS